MARAQLDASVRSARVLALLAELGETPVLELWGTKDGLMPADTRAPALGTLVARTRLKAGWMRLPVNGASEMAAPWTLKGARGVAPTQVSYFRMYRDGLPRCLLQGDVKLTMFDATMTINALRVEEGQAIEITRFTIEDANA